MNYRIFFSRFLFFVVALSSLKAQQPGNNTLMQYYAGRNFSNYTFHSDGIYFGTDLSKNFAFQSSFLLNNIISTLQVTNFAPSTKENMALLNFNSANYWDKNYFSASASSRAEKNFRAGLGFKKTIKGIDLSGNIQGSFYQQQKITDRIHTGYTDMPLNQAQSLSSRLNINFKGKEHFYTITTDVNYLAGKNYFGRINSGKIADAASIEAYRLRQNRTLYTGKLAFHMRNANYRNLLDAAITYKHYGDTTTGGLQHYSAVQDVLYGFAQNQWKLKHVNLIAGASALLDKAGEKLNGAAVDRNIFVPGIFSQAEFSKHEQLKFTLQYSLDFHPVFGPMFQPSARLDLKPFYRFNLGFFYNRGERAVNVLQENFMMISGNRNIIVPLNMMNESYHRAGCAADYNITRWLKAKFVYHFNYFNRYVFADPTATGNTLQFYTILNNFQKHVFETSVIFSARQGSYLSVKMRNNIFYLYTEKGKIAPYYTPATDISSQGFICFFNQVESSKDVKKTIGLQVNQYLALGEKALAKSGDGYSWQQKNFYQLDAELVFRADGKNLYNDEKKKYTPFNSFEFKISWVNVTSFIQPDIFLQSPGNNTMNGLQTWANISPSRIFFTLTYKPGKFAAPWSKKSS